MEYKPSFVDQLDVNYISHHGILGMHWGIRRFQNKDGSLTPEGKKRYYSDNGQLTQEGRRHYYDYDFHGMLNNEGREFNKQASKDYNNYAETILNDTKKSNPDFDKKVKRHKKLQKMNRESYKKDFDNFLKGEDYKDLDYEDFKDEAYSRWRKTDIGKEQEEIRKDLRKMLEDTVSKNKDSSKTFKRLRDFNSNVYDEMHNIPYKEAMDDFETINYGKYVVNTLINHIEHD